MKSAEIEEQCRWGAVGVRVMGVAVLAVAALMFVSMAVAGGLGRVVVESNPSGAQVMVGSRVVGKTPATLSLPADGDSVKLKVVKDGYKPKVVTVVPESGKTKRIKVRLRK